MYLPGSGTSIINQRHLFYEPPQPSCPPCNTDRRHKRHTCFQYLINAYHNTDKSDTAKLQIEIIAQKKGRSYVYGKIYPSKQHQTLSPLITNVVSQLKSA